MFHQGAHPGARGILPENVRLKCLAKFEIRFDCADSHKVGAAVLGPRMYPANFRVRWFLRNVDLYFAARVRTKCVSAFWVQSGPRHFSCKFL